MRGKQKEAELGTGGEMREKLRGDSKKKDEMGEEENEKRKGGMYRKRARQKHAEGEKKSKNGGRWE